MKHTSLFVAAIGLAGAATPVRVEAQAHVDAGGQQCISWSFVRSVKGVYDLSYIQYANRCTRQMTFFLCQFSSSSTMAGRRATR